MLQQGKAWVGAGSSLEGIPVSIIPRRVVLSQESSASQQPESEGDSLPVETVWAEAPDGVNVRRGSLWGPHWVEKEVKPEGRGECLRFEVFLSEKGFSEKRNEF